MSKIRPKSLVISNFYLYLRYFPLCVLKPYSLNRSAMCTPPLILCACCVLLLAGCDMDDAVKATRLIDLCGRFDAAAMAAIKWTSVVWVDVHDSYSDRRGKIAGAKVACRVAARASVRAISLSVVSVTEIIVGIKKEAATGTISDASLWYGSGDYEELGIENPCCLPLLCKSLRQKREECCRFCGTKGSGKTR